MQHDFILLDRSGSMATQWDQALSSINGYVKKLADEKVDTGVTLMTFDNHMNTNLFEVIRDRITPPTWKGVTLDECWPRGGTPLNEGIHKLVGLANEGVNGQQYDKVAIIIMTDGYENASLPEYTQETVKALLDACRAKGWQVIFLGANFDNVQQAKGYGTMAAQQVHSSTRNLGATMSSMASKRGLYGSGAAATMDFAEDEKAELKKQ